jgi:hypothetical protein
MKADCSILMAHGKRLLATVLVVGLVLGWAGSPVRADAITDENVDATVANAKTAADHQALAAYFTTKSEEALANVERHKRMSNSLGGGKPGANWEAHCQSLIRTYQAQAKDYAGLAKEQAAFAKGLQQGK